MTNPKILLTDFSFRHLAWWLDHKCFGYYSYYSKGGWVGQIIGLPQKRLTQTNIWTFGHNTHFIKTSGSSEHLWTEWKTLRQRRRIEKRKKKRIGSALKECGYLKWAMDKVKHQITIRLQKPTMKSTQKDNRALAWAQRLQCSLIHGNFNSL